MSVYLSVCLMIYVKKLFLDFVFEKQSIENCIELINVYGRSIW